MSVRLLEMLAQVGRVFFNQARFLSKLFQVSLSVQGITKIYTHDTDVLL